MRLLRNHALTARVLNNPNYWLLGIAIGLISVHLQLLWRLTGNFNAISLELIGWSGILFCLWRRRETLVFRSDSISRFVGWALIALVIVRSVNMRTASSGLLSLTPLAIGFAIALIAVGLKQFNRYQRELWMVAVIALPVSETVNVIDRLTNFSLLMAKYSHVLMWYLGFTVQRNGAQLILPTGAVEVLPGCSGVEAALISLKVAVFFLLVFPTRLREKFFVPAIAVATAFGVNGFRIMLLAHFVAAKDMKTFEFWHIGYGAQIFSMISMSLLTSYCQWLIEPKPTDESSDAERASGAVTSLEELEHSSSK